MVEVDFLDLRLLFLGPLPLLELFIGRQSPHCSLPTRILLLYLVDQLLQLEIPCQLLTVIGSAT
jgi:hypothetical protein